MDRVTISAKGWVVIPAHYRAKYGLVPGTEVQVVDYGGVLSIVPVPADPIRASRGLFKGKTSLTKALLAEHKKELARGR